MKTISGTTPLGAATEKRGYDTQGRVAAQSRTLTNSGDTLNTYNFYDGANLVEQWVSDSGNGGLPSALVNQFVYEGVDQPIYASLGTNSVVYELDLAGNVRRLRLAADGTDLGGYRYTAFGQVYPADGATPAPTTSTGTAFTATTQPLQWKGRPAIDFGGGFYDMRARWWSPQLGAFTSVDELVCQDARSTLWGWPGQNPLKWSDPSGHVAIGLEQRYIVYSAIVAAAVGGGVVAANAVDKPQCHAPSFDVPQVQSQVKEKEEVGADAGSPPARLVMGAGRLSRWSFTTQPGDVTLDRNPAVLPEIIADYTHALGTLDGAPYAGVLFERVPSFTLTGQAATNAYNALGPGGQVQVLTGAGASTLATEQAVQQTFGSAGFHGVTTCVFPGLACIIGFK